MNNQYNNSMIYKLVDSENNNLMLYIGSTTPKENSKCPMSKRLWQHKSLLKRNKHDNKKLTEYMKDKNLENLKIILIEKFVCNNRNELLAREVYFIKLFQNEIFNEMGAYLSEQQKKEYKKEWFHKNYEIKKEKLKLYRDEWNEINTNYDKEYYQKNLYKFVCDICEYHTAKKTQFNKHNATKKHQINILNK